MRAVFRRGLQLFAKQEAEEAACSLIDVDGELVDVATAEPQTLPVVRVQGRDLEIVLGDKSYLAYSPLGSEDHLPLDAPPQRWTELEDVDAKWDHLVPVSIKRPRSRRRAAKKLAFRANPGRQARFVGSAVDELLWGGEAGGGKSQGAILLAARFIHLEGFSALILRREASDLAPLLKKAHALYRSIGGIWQASIKTYFFPRTGATIRFNHCQREVDAFQYQGDEFHLVIFDELTHFLLSQYLEVSSRLRRTSLRLPLLLRATSNPGGPGHEWVFGRWRYWLDPKAEIAGRAPRVDANGETLPPAAEGEVLWFAPAGEDGAEQVVPEGTPLAKSRTYYRSVRNECEQLDRKDYEANLARLDAVRRAQLSKGDWLKKPAAGDYFKRIWFGVTPRAVAAPIARVRYWDRAGTVDGDWTAGPLVARTEEGFVVEGLRHFRGTPGTVEAEIVQTALLDGPDVVQLLEQDPAQAGLSERRTITIALNKAGVTNFRWVQKRTNKLIACSPASVQTEAGCVSVVPGSWNDDFFAELEAFPEGAHDDIVDSYGGAIAWLLRAHPGQSEGQAKAPQVVSSGSSRAVFGGNTRRR